MNRALPLFAGLCVTTAWLSIFTSHAQVGLPFPGPGGVAGPAAATVTYNTGGSATNDAPGSATVSFTGLAIGTASADRYVACAAYGRNGAGVSISSVTIGGISATKLVTVNNAGGDVSEIWIANVTTGTTATLAVTFNATPTAAYGGCWEIHHLLNAGAATSTATTTTNNAGMTLAAVSSGGIVLATSGDHNNGTTSWTNVTSNWDNHPNRSQSGASVALAAAQTNYVVTGNLSAIASPTFASVSLR